MMGYTVEFGTRGREYICIKLRFWRQDTATQMARRIADVLGASDSRTIFEIGDKMFSMVGWDNATHFVELRRGRG